MLTINKHFAVELNSPVDLFASLLFQPKRIF